LGWSETSEVPTPSEPADERAAARDDLESSQSSPEVAKWPFDLGAVRFQGKMCNKKFPTIVRHRERWQNDDSRR
jgi:hypothetical protein